MKKLIALIFIASTIVLSGCDTMPVIKDKEIVTTYKYVVKAPPDEFTIITPRAFLINPKQATDKEVAKWIVDSEVRAADMESKLKAIKQYYEDLILNLKVPPTDIIKD